MLVQKKSSPLGRIATPALAGALALSMAGAAQADVTLYQGDGKIPSVIGYVRVDAGLRFGTDVDLAQYNGGQAGKTTTLMQAAGNDWGTSMFGLHGTAQLTPDLAAIYRIESGFDATKGTFNSSTNSIFNRRAYGGLSNPKLGSIYFGKDLFINNDVYNFDPMIQENMSTPTLVYGRNWPGASDMIEYRSPNWGGLQIGAQASFGNGDTSMSTKLSNMYGVSVQYDYKILSLFGIYDEIQDKNGHYTNLYSASREGIVGATLDLKPVKLFVGFEQLDAPDGTREKGGSPIHNPGATYFPYAPVYATSANMTWVGAAIQATPDLLFRTGWYRTSVNHQGGNANLVTGGVEYSLSKNVMVYFTLGEVINSGQANFSADVYAPPPAPGKNQFGGFNGISIQF